MYKIGITGSIGTGKTSVAKVFALFKIPIFDADREVKKLLSKKKVKRRLKNIWPDITKNGYVDKLKLKTIIFAVRSVKVAAPSSIDKPLRKLISKSLVSKDNLSLLGLLSKLSKA